jgi:hypothetical protein
MRSTHLWRLAASVAVLACALLTTASAAHAQATAQLPEVVEDNLLSFAEYAKLEGLDPNTPCPKPCSDLVEDLQRPATAAKDPVPARMLESLVDNRVPEVEPVYRFSWGLPTLFTAGGLLYANYRVWKYHVYGAHPKDFYIHLSAAATDISQLSWQLVDGSYDLWYGTSWDLPNPLPVGAIARTYGRGAIVWQTEQQGDHDQRCEEQALEPTPPDVEVYSWHWNECSTGKRDDTGNPIYAHVYAHGWKTKIESAFDPSLDPPGNPDTPQSIPAGANDDMTLNDMKARIDKILRDPEYTVLKDWACAVFGGDCQNPRDAYHTTPDCTGLTAAACTQAFRDAGFTGTITTETLDADTAVMEQPAGRVTATYPHEGIQIAEPRTFRIYVNPDPMPTMTATDTSIANTLKDQNPDTVTDANKGTIARTCREDMQRAGRATSDCTLLPIMVAGNDQETPARNTLQGLLRNPAWIVLNARVSKGLSRGGWYSDLGEPAPGCLLDEKEVDSWSCDEYPFWSTLQAHGGTLNFGIAPSIRWAPAPEHQRQANVINQFYSKKNPGQVLKFPGCEITKQAPADTTPLQSSAFIVLPLPFSSAIQSTSVCNKPVVHDDTPDPTEDPNP